MNTSGLSSPFVAQQLAEISWNELTQMGAQTLITAWVFVLGSCIGSFLNVVIYRLPAGMSLGWPQSRCPQCETPLAVRDNIPVFGWLILRGRCRYCGSPISPRYPSIEAVCGGLFVLLMFVELLTGAANLPVRQVDDLPGSPNLWLARFMTWKLSCICLYHCLLLVLILATVMIAFDGHLPQSRLTLFGVIAGLMCGVIWREIRPVSAGPWPHVIHRPVFADWISASGLFDGLSGLTGGWVSGWLVRQQMSSKKPAPSQTEVVMSSREVDATRPVIEGIAASFLVIGVFLGWQACGQLAIVTLPTLALVKWFCAKDHQCLGWRGLAPGFFVAAVGFLICWRWLDAVPWLPCTTGWSFTDLGWHVEWALTWLLLALFAVLIGSGRNFVGSTVLE